MELPMGSTRTNLRAAYLGMIVSFFGCSSADVPESVWKYSDTVSNYTPGVRTLEFSPTGDHLASVHMPLHPWNVRSSSMLSTPQLKIWFSSQEELWPRLLMSQEVDADFPTFDERGEHLLARTKTGLWSYDLTDNTSSLTPLDFESDTVLELSANGELALIREEGGSVCIRRTDTGKMVSTLDHSDLEWFPQIFSSDSKLVLCGGTKGRVHLFDVSTGKSLLNFQAGSLRYPIRLSASHESGPSKSGQPLLMAAYDETAIAVGVWSLETGKLIQHHAVGWEEVWDVALSADASFLAVSGESNAEDGERTGLVRFWNLKTGEQLEPIRDDSTWGITAVAFSPDGRRLATGDSEGVIKLWPLPEEMQSAVKPE